MIHYAKWFICFLIVAFLIPFGNINYVQAKDEVPNTSLRFALNFNESMNRCMQSGCANIEELIGFFADECSYLDDTGQLWSGKASIRKQLLRTKRVAGTSDRVESIDVAASIVTIRLERRRVFKTGKYDVAETKPHIQVILLKSGRIARLVSVISPD